MSTMTRPVYSAQYAVRRPMASAIPQTAPRLRPVSSIRALPTLTTAAKIRAIFSGRNVTIIVVSIVLLIVGRLVLSVAIDANAYAIAAKAHESQNLGRDAQLIGEQLNVLNSPQHLSSVAQGLGMISNARPAYLRISDGKVWGNPYVVGQGSIDRTTIANSLESALIPRSTARGVASVERVSGGADSVKTRTTVTSTSGIPAPNTH
ncbi:unannotated protein [freshwater metagenome]|uniref:Unannotated protein n=1 Tax=freshwater metagenome TaxID=449393 RepID=A0A6J6I8E6_9ZZZZ|nr:hypothetical protein [Actinomycetota bacterium]MUH52927.1 hypothetical protein [Actinomycetota bacterium]